MQAPEKYIFASIPSSAACLTSGFCKSVAAHDWQVDTLEEFVHRGLEGPLGIVQGDAAVQAQGILHLGVEQQVPYPVETES